MGKVEVMTVRPDRCDDITSGVENKEVISDDEEDLPKRRIADILAELAEEAARPRRWK